MEQLSFDNLPTQTKFETYSKEELIRRYSILESEVKKLLKENYKLRNQNISDTQIQLVLEAQITDLQDKIYGTKSEKYKKSSDSNNNKPKNPSKPRIQKPSERYPNLPVVEKIITQSPVPICSCCGHEMCDSGLTENTEQLNVIPKRYEIILQKRVKYNCSKCHGNLQIAPAPERIRDGSSFSNDLIIDVAMSKYCDLIPIERYVAMAGRSGLKGLPAHSLIETTHHLANYLKPVYNLIKEEIAQARVLMADETPHRMLEGSETKRWFLWGFSTNKSCYFEYHDTRSADVAIDVLVNSRCEILVTDDYSGYGKTVRVSNEKRKDLNLPQIKRASCNAHARRYFFNCWKVHNLQEAEFYLDQYHEIYKLEAKTEDKNFENKLKIREQMKIYFEKIKTKSYEDLLQYSNKHKLTKAIKYYISNYTELTRFLTDPDIPIDNNSQERLLRSPVVGRKTWYGTHSERGAGTAAILFSIVESCKLNKINPREYTKNLVQDLFEKKKPYSPKEFADLCKNNVKP